MIIADLSVWSEFMCSVTEALLTLFIFFDNPHFLGTPVFAQESILHQCLRSKYKKKGLINTNSWMVSSQISDNKWLRYVQSPMMHVD